MVRRHKICQLHIVARNQAAERHIVTAEFCAERRRRICCTVIFLRDRDRIRRCRDLALVDRDVAADNVIAVLPRGNKRLHRAAIRIAETRRVNYKVRIIARNISTKRNICRRTSTLSCAIRNLIILSVISHRNICAIILSRKGAVLACRSHGKACRRSGCVSRICKIVIVVIRCCSALEKCCQQRCARTLIDAPSSVCFSIVGNDIAPSFIYIINLP